MSGHSKWANIKRKKSKVDDARGKIFTKISKEILVAVKQGGPDPEGNFRLKLCVQKAKDNNMPGDNIARCIQKAAGVGNTEAYEEFFYEGYGAGGVAVLCAILTDNRNRTASEIRYIFSRNHGNLGETGCVSWMFERRGQITVALEGKDEEELMLFTIDAGADDFTADTLFNEDEEEEPIAEIVCSPDLLEKIRTALEGSGYKVTEAEITMLPSNTVDVNDKTQAAQLLTLIEALEDNDDVQAVYANYDIPDHIMESLE